MIMCGHTIKIDWKYHHPIFSLSKFVDNNQNFEEENLMTFCFRNNCK